MRRLMTLFVLAVLGWAGWWFIGSAGLKGGLEAWFAARRADGWVAEYADLRVRGFPNRFDSTFTQLELADTKSGLAWSAPFFQIFALSYKPHHIVAVWPDSQRLATPEETLDIAAGNMRGSLVFVPGPDLALERAVIELESIGLASSHGWQGALEAGQVAMRAVASAPETGFAYDLDIGASGVSPAASFLKALESTALLPARMEGLSMDATVTFDAPWDRYAIERARPQPRQIALDLIKAKWGALDLWMSGRLEIDSTGTPTGEIALRARNWRAMLDVAVQAGVLPEALRPSVESAIEAVATLSGDPDNLETTLNFQRGFVALGFVPIGPAPRIHLR